MTPSEHRERTLAGRGNWVELSNCYRNATCEELPEPSTVHWTGQGPDPRRRDQIGARCTEQPKALGPPDRGLSHQVLSSASTPYVVGKEATTLNYYYYWRKLKQQH